MLYASSRESAPTEHDRLWTVARDGGPSERIPSPWGHRGSFSAAAESLSYTQSAVSQQIAALERDGIQPGTHAPLPELPRPPQAQPVWEELLP